MRRFATAMALTALLLLPARALAVVNIEDNGYNPAKVTISPGSSVTWHYANATTLHGVQIGSTVVCPQSNSLLGSDCSSQAFQTPARITYHDVNCDPSTDSSCISGQIVVYLPPTAKIAASPTTVLRNQSVSFDGSGSASPGGSITGYSWN